MANDHFISRFLTKPWEIGQRRLHFYDFKSGTFDERSSESLFAADGLHSEETGHLLSKLIESPVSNHRAEIIRRGGEMVDVGDNWKLYRALAALIWLQAQRDEDARSAGQNKTTLDDLFAHGEGLVNAIASKASETRQLIGVTLPTRSHPLFFTEAVYFPIPMVGVPPILAVPLTPRHFVALPEKGLPKKQLNDWLARPEVISAFSIGLGGPINRVVIPPEILGAKEEDAKGFEQGLIGARLNCAKIFDLIGQVNQVAGFPSFKVTR